MTQLQPNTEDDSPLLFRGVSAHGGNVEFASLVASLVEGQDRPAAHAYGVPELIANISAAAAFVAKTAGNCAKGRRSDIETVSDLRTTIAVAVIAARSITRQFPELSPPAQFEAANASISADLLVEDMLSRKAMSGESENFDEIGPIAREAGAQWAVIGMQMEAVIPQVARAIYGLSADFIGLNETTRKVHYRQLGECYLDVANNLSCDQELVMV